MRISGISLAIIDVVDDIYEVGNHSITWDSRDDMGQYVASGIYFYRLVAKDFKETKKMMLLK